MKLHITQPFSVEDAVKYVRANEIEGILILRSVWNDWFSIDENGDSPFPIIDPPTFLGYPVTLME